MEIGACFSAIRKGVFPFRKHFPAFKATSRDLGINLFSRPAIQDGMSYSLNIVLPQLTPSLGGQTTRTATARSPPSAICRNGARRHDKIRVDEQYPKRQLCQLRWASAVVELYGYWNGRMQREGSGADGRGKFFLHGQRYIGFVLMGSIEDDTTSWQAAGSAGLRFG